MKLSELLLEYNSNPFVSIVSSIDLKIRDVEGAIAAGSNKIFIASLMSQLSNLAKLVDSAANWNIPDPKLRAEFHAMLPPVKHHIKSALLALNTGEVTAAKDHLFSARKITIARSHLQFGDIQ